MHELGATQSVINTLLSECKQRSLKTIHEVEVSIGVLTTYEEKPFTYYFDLIKVQHVPLSSTTLKTEKIPGKLECEDCGKITSILIAFDMSCRHCKGIKTKIVEGKDIIIKSIQVNKKGEINAQSKIK